MSGNAKRRRDDLALRKSSKQLERNRCWDELNTIYTNCAAMLYQHKAMAELAKDKDLIQYVTDKQTLVMNIRSLSQDLLHLNTELQTLHAQHAEKTRGAKDEHEMIQTFRIAEQYNLFMERHNGVVLPTVYHILEVFNQAEEARLRAQAAAGQPSAAATAAAQSTADTGPIDVPHRDLPAAAAAPSMVLPAGQMLQ